MSEPREPRPAKLIAGLLFGDLAIRNRALLALNERFGPADCITEPKPFTYTDYYDGEIGPGIQRQTISFTELVHPVKLAEIKLFTNELERQLSCEGRRRINIDPGLLSEERIVLATGKNYTHRVYLRDGIYADLTLIYQAGSYQKLPWTYPDYLEPMLLHFFSALRRKLIFQRNGRLPRKGMP
jgi:hypothetical protein